MRSLPDYVDISDSCRHVVCRKCLQQHISTNLKNEDTVVYCPLDLKSNLHSIVPLTEEAVTEALDEIGQQLYRAQVERHKAMLL